ncbi:carbohydrate ABC transporter permease [Streptomyces johnsoniae]|uniref:Sugar ABC transporter permease n=1 Tax=Streptomyces johnsoniae TaxID=3075532 RepID=A0ABU2SDU1_9ACTN|nr:sugar ABC transporter permease [Streptomyces sp. DSM 41886]MDT0447141.1 sugar ABC transporter permease [Streptomyces sp. DSM 41886]
MTVTDTPDTRVAPAAVQPAAGRRASRAQTWAPYLFISPFYVLFLLFMVVPISIGAFLSMTSWTGVGTPEWVGLDNYARLFDDPSFYTAVFNTSVFTIGTMCVVLPLSLMIASALNARGLKLRDFFRTIFFLPVVVSPIVVALVFGLFFDQQFGLVNGLTQSVLGSSGIEWLTSPFWAKVVVIILVLWRWTGYLTMFFLAGLQNVSHELHEAAQIDGAGPIRGFWSVTLPQLRPVTAFIGVTVLVSTAQIFEEPFLLTQGGPGEATMSVAQFIYRAAFQRQELGYASAAGVVMFVAVFLLGRIAIRVFGAGDNR